MRPRHAVLLSPLGSAVPIYLPIGTLNAPVTSLESALTSPYQLTENTATLSPTESALTRLSRVTPLDSALTKNMGVGAYTSQLRTGRSLLPTPHATQVLFFTFLRTLLRFSARRQNSTHLFSIASTLFAKNTLGGKITSSLTPVSDQSPTGLTKPRYRRRRTRGTFLLPRKRERTGRQQRQTGCRLPR
jgi:hypothetical protein